MFLATQSEVIRNMKRARIRLSIGNMLYTRICITLLREFCGLARLSITQSFVPTKLLRITSKLLSN